MAAMCALLCGSIAPASANPRYAAYVIDANTGKVLFSRNADERRYPASLTKMMTIYLVFEAMKAGRISPKTQITFSKNAAGEPPTKLGVPAGRSIPFDTAIRALVTRSANDVSTAIGETLGGSEANFARMMTAKARQLGMSRTQFRNAHGLPNSEQYTTARDMAVLGIALREHFPQYYDYFSTRSFKYGKQNITSHNNMFGRIKGVDGIKTGYIRASGFNLVTSVQDNGRNVVGVVMGGRTARTRDDHMAALLREYLPQASRGGGGALIASHTMTPGAAAVVAAGAFSLPTKNIPLPGERPGELSAVTTTAYAMEAPAPERFSPPAMVPVKPVEPAPVSAAPVEPAAVAKAEAVIDPVQTSSTNPGGWSVQVASSPSQSEALSFLAATKERAGDILGGVEPFTQTFDNKGTVYYRARFGGFASKDAAWSACNQLKKKSIDCFADQS